MILIACFTLNFLLKLIPFLKSFSLFFAYVIHSLILFLELSKAALFCFKVVFKLDNGVMIKSSIKFKPHLLDFLPQGELPTLTCH